MNLWQDFAQLFMVFFGGFQIESFFCAIREIESNASVGHNSYSDDYSSAAVESEILSMDSQIDSIPMQTSHKMCPNAILGQATAKSEW